MPQTTIVTVAGSNVIVSCWTDGVRTSKTSILPHLRREGFGFIDRLVERASQAERDGNAATASELLAEAVRAECLLRELKRGVPVLV